MRQKRPRKYATRKYDFSPKYETSPLGHAVLETCAGVKDPRQLLEHGVATIVRVSQSHDLDLAMEAARWLVDYAKSEMQREKLKPGEEKIQIIAELRGLYQKALQPANTSPLVIESQAEDGK
jgi:hypothetical protein